MDPKIVEQLQERERLLAELTNRKKERGMDFYIPNPIQLKAHKSKAKVIAYVGGNRAGKCLPLYTPILMVDGKWEVIKNIKIGDRVISQDGFGIVLGKINSGVRNCYKVTFEDGGYLIASEEHHFPMAYGSGRKFKKRTIGELVKRKKCSTSKKVRFLSYKNIEFENSSLPLHPYLLGALLGDGSLTYSGLGFTNNDPIVINRVDCLLREIGFKLKHRGDFFYSIKSINKIEKDKLGRFGKSKFSETLNNLDVRKNAYGKKIPEIYKYASVKDRKELLAGLIDTDGSLHEFCSVSQDLAKDFVFLVKSLGGKATLSEALKTCSNSKTKKQVKAYRVYWRLNDTLPLCRKDKQRHTKREINYEHRIVRKIEYVGKEECQDIEISHPSHNFVSWDWIVTGNTTLGAMEVAWHVTKKYPDWFPKERRFDRPVKIRIATDKFFKIDTVIEPKLRAYLPVNEIKRIRRSPQGYMTKLSTRDGSFIEFLTMEQDQMAFEGQDLDLFWGDEPVNRARYIATQRGLLDRGGFTLLTFTPLVEPWMKEELVDKAGKDIAVFTADVRDNKFDTLGNPILKEEDIVRWEDMLTDDEKETRIHGKFFHLRGVVYKEFGDIHLIDRFKYEQGYPVVCVLDPHDRQPHWITWAMVDRIDDIYVMYESIVHCTTQELAATVLATEKHFGWSVRKRLIDPNFGRRPARIGASASLIDELRKYRCVFTEANDNKEAGQMKVKSYLHYNKDRPIDINNKPKLFFIRDSVSRTIHSMLNLQHDEWKGQTDRDPKEDIKPKDTHGADCIRYLCMDNPTFDGPRIYEPDMSEAY